MAKTKPVKETNPASTSSPDSDYTGVPNTHSATYNHTSVGVKAPKKAYKIMTWKLHQQSHQTALQECQHCCETIFIVIFKQ